MWALNAARSLFIVQHCGQIKNFISDLFYVESHGPLLGIYITHFGKTYPKVKVSPYKRNKSTHVVTTIIYKNHRIWKPVYDRNKGECIEQKLHRNSTRD